MSRADVHYSVALFYVFDYILLFFITNSHLNCNGQCVFVTCYRKMCAACNRNIDMLYILIFTAYEHWGTTASAQEDHHECVGE